MENTLFDDIEKIKMNDAMMEEIRRKKRGGRPRSTKRPDNETLLAMYEIYTAGELSELWGIPKGSIKAWAFMARKERDANGR